MTRWGSVSWVWFVTITTITTTVTVTRATVPTITSLHNQTDDFVQFAHWEPFQVNSTWYACGSHAGQYEQPSGPLSIGSFVRLVKLDTATMQWIFVQSFSMLWPRVSRYVFLDDMHLVLVGEATTGGSNFNVLKFDETTERLVLHQTWSLSNYNGITVIEQLNNVDTQTLQLVQATFVAVSVMGNPGDPTPTTQYVYKWNNSTLQFDPHQSIDTAGSAWAVHVRDFMPSVAWGAVRTCLSTGYADYLLVLENSVGTDYNAAAVQVFVWNCETALFEFAYSKVDSSLGGFWGGTVLQVQDDQNSVRKFVVAAVERATGGYNAESVVYEWFGTGMIETARFQTFGATGVSSWHTTHGLLHPSGDRDMAMVAQYGPASEGVADGAFPVIVYWNGTALDIGISSVMRTTANWGVTFLQVQGAFGDTSSTTNSSNSSTQQSAHLAHCFLSANGVVEATIDFVNNPPDTSFFHVFNATGLSSISTNSPTFVPSSSPSQSPTFAPTTGAPTTGAPTGAPTDAPTDAPTTTFPTTSPSYSPSHSPSRWPTVQPTLMPSVVPTASPSRSPTTTAFAESETRRIASVKLEETQKTGVPVLLWLIVGAAASFTLVVIVCKVWKLERGTTDYVRILRFMWALIDVFSDILFVSTVWQTATQENASFMPYAAGAICSLFGAIACSVLISLYAVLRERASYHPFAIFCKRHPTFVPLCVLCSIFRSDAILLFQTHLANRVTDFFQAPLNTGVRRRLRKWSLVPFLLEDVGQLCIVFLLQNKLLGGWTTLNVLSFASSLATVVASLFVYIVRIHKHHEGPLQDLCFPPHKTRSIARQANERSIELDM